MSKRYVAALVIIIFVSCSSVQTKENSEFNSDSSVSTRPTNKATLGDMPTGQKLPADSPGLQKGNEVHLAFNQDMDSFTTKCHVDTALKPLFCYLRINKGKRLVIKLETLNGQGNIRINQITSPANKSEGPFGQSLDYQITQTGIYKITIGSSLMADNPFTGELLLHFKLQ